MDSRLQLLINHYEKEESDIQQSIDNCLKEDADYLMAYNLSKVLNKTKQRLRIFKYMADSLYNEKTSLITRIKMLENRIRFNDREFMTPSFAEMLDKAKKDLEKLNQQHQEPEKPDITFDDTLAKLMAGQIKYFDLILNKSKDLFLEFKIVTKQFKITIPNIKKLTENFQFIDYQLKEFKKLGFNLNKNESKMVLLLPFKTTDDTQQLKIILSRIVFEVLQSGRESLRETFIEYKT